MSKSKSTRRVAAAFIALSMFAVACGDDEETTGTTAAVETTAAPGTTTEETSVETTMAPMECIESGDDNVKVGTTIWTNELISLEIRLPGLAASIDYINCHGGVGGKFLEWIYCGAADANEGEACANKMVEEGVVATLTDANYSAEQVNTDVLTAAGIPLIDPFVNGEASLTNPNVYMFCQPTPLDYAAMVAHAAAVDAKTVWNFYGESSQAERNMAIIQQAADFYGLEVLGRTAVPLSAADYLPQVQATMDGGADVNLAIIAPFMSALVLQSAQQLGVNFKMGVSYGQFNDAQYAEYGAAGGPLEDAFLVSCTPPTGAAADIPAMQEAVAGFAEYAANGADAHIRELSAADQLTGYAYRAWFSTIAFWKAINDLDEVTAATVKEALDSSEGIDYGLAEPWVPSNEGPAGFTRVSNTKVYLITVKDGVAVLVQDEPIDIAEPFR